MDGVWLRVNLSMENARYLHSLMQTTANSDWSGVINEIIKYSRTAVDVWEDEGKDVVDGKETNTKTDC